jgi:DNA-binding response OmpR family regulator
MHRTDLHAPAKTKTRQVFLVNSKSDDIGLARRAISQACYAVHLEVLPTVTALISMLEGQDVAVSIDLVLVDLDLPNDSAFRLVRWLRKNPNTRHVPMVMIANHEQERDIVLGYEAGANSIILKPAAFTDYACMLKDVCSYWLNLSLAPPFEYMQRYNQLMANVS